MKKNFWNFTAGASREEALSAYLDSELSESARREVESKLREQPELQTELESLREVRQGIRQWFHEEVETKANEKPIDVWQNIESVIRADIRARSFGAVTFGDRFRELLALSLQPRFAAAMAAGCAAVVLAVVTREVPVENFASNQQVPLVVHGANANIQVAANLPTDASHQLIGGLSEREADDLLSRVGFPASNRNASSGFPRSVPMAESLAGRFVSYSRPLNGGVSGGLRAGGADIEWIKTERPFRIVHSHRDAAAPVIWVANMQGRPPGESATSSN